MTNIDLISFDDHSPIGRFRFRTVPRKGDQVTVPMQGAPGGVRIYDVEEVDHWGESGDAPETVEGPRIVLSVTEII